MTRFSPAPHGAADGLPQAWNPVGGAGMVAAGAADTDVLAALIADAFHPLAPSRWLIPHPADRRKIFPAYFRLYVEHALPHGAVYTTPGRDAAALWIHAGPGGAGQPEGYPGQLAAITGEWASRFRCFDTLLDSRHPEVPHHHLAILAVRPSRQGNGLGTGLLRASHQIIDHAGARAYLEASGLGTRGLYLRHGYTDHGDPIQLPNGPRMYPMVRQALPRRARAAGDSQVPQPGGLAAQDQGPGR